MDWYKMSKNQPQNKVEIFNFVNKQLFFKLRTRFSNT